MAAVVLKRDHKLNGPELYSHLLRTLPAYAWPRFLRVQVSNAAILHLQCVYTVSVRFYCSSVFLTCFFQTSLDVTETFKQQKTKLVQEGFHPDVTQDPLYFLDVSQQDYVPLTASTYQDIVSGKIHL